MIVKPLSAALRDEDHVYALVRGSAISANGFSRSLTMPLAEAQKVRKESRMIDGRTDKQTDRQVDEPINRG